MRWVRGRTLLSAVVLLASAAPFVAATPPAAAATATAPDSTRDPTFADNGRLLTAAPVGHDRGIATVRQSNGSLVVLGTADIPSGTEGALPARKGEGYLLRLTAAGAKDESFGTKGEVHALADPDPTAQPNLSFLPSDGAVDGLDRIVVAGATTGSWSSQALSFPVIRLLPNGARDLTFGPNGRRDLKIPSEFAPTRVLDVTTDAANNVYVSFHYQPYDGGGVNEGVGVVRFRAADGAKDPLWSGDGVTMIGEPLNFHVDYGGHHSGMAAAPNNGGVYLAGTSFSPEPNRRPHASIAKLSSAGALDPSWGSGGIAMSSVTPPDDTGHAARFDDVVVQPDGKVVAVGAYAAQYTKQFGAVVRFLTVGQQDPSYGTNGVAQLAAENQAEIERLTHLGIDAGNNVVAMGVSGPYAWDDDTTLLRVKPTGVLDTAYGTGGRTVLPDVKLHSVLVLPDGRPLATGGVHEDTTVVRTTTTGAMDPSFADEGVLWRNIGRAGKVEVRDVVGAPDGSIYIAGQADDSIAVFRVLRTGTLDPAYGERGVAVLQFGVRSAGVGIALGPNGTVYVGGRTQQQYRDSGDLVVARLLPGGAPDPAWGEGGVAVRPFGDNDNFILADIVTTPGGVAAVGSLDVFNGTDGMYFASFDAAGELASEVLDEPLYVRTAATDANGNVVVAGLDTAYDRTWWLDLRRYSASGARDTTFNPSATSGDRTFKDPADLLIVPNGNIVVTGYFETNGAYEDRAALANYLPNGQFNPAFGTAGIAHLPIGEHTYGLARQADGKLVTSLTNMWGLRAATRVGANGATDGSYGTDGISRPVDIERTFVVVAPSGHHYLVGKSKSSTHDRSALEVVRLVGTSTGPRPPSVTDVDPDQICSMGHQRVRVTGTGFTTARQVLFEGTPSPYFRVLSDGVLEAFSPEDRPVIEGHVQVVNAVGPSETSPADAYRRDACFRDGTGDLKTRGEVVGTPRPNEPFVLRMTVTNEHDAEAVLVKLAGRLPDGLSLVSATPSRGTCSGLTDVVCELGDFFAHDRVTVDVKVRSAAAASYSVTWTATSPYGIEPTPGDNKATISLDVAGVGPGYWMLASDGRVYPFGGLASHGHATPSLAPGTSAVDITPTSDGAGYWILDSLGSVYGFGSALYHGGRPALRPGERPTSLSATRGGAGYWIFTSHGRAIPYGNARFFGDMGGRVLNGPVLDSSAMPDDTGYYMVASDGGIFAFGTARFHGSMGGQPLNRPVNGIAADPDATGYWLVADDGGIFAFAAQFRGSMGGTPLNKPVIGMVPYGKGYLMVASDGGIFSFSDKPFAGSLGGTPIPHPIVAVAAHGG